MHDIPHKQLLFDDKYKPEEVSLKEASPEIAYRKESSKMKRGGVAFFTFNPPLVLYF